MRLRFLVLSVSLALSLLPPAAVAQNKVHDVNITVELATDGSARVREIWEMTLSRGTEVYLGRENLGDIKILDLTVSDELGETYKTERNWDTERPFEKKKNRCGLNAISGGYEICWGIGAYGHRTYTVDYTLTHLVKSLEDYDMIHYQFVTPNDFRSEHVKVTLSKPGFVMDTLTRIWAFGFGGAIRREGGSVIAESEEPLDPGHSVIILMRFDKGIFYSKSVQERPFQTVLDRALEGADRPEVPRNRLEEAVYEFLGILFLIGMVVLPFLPLITRIVQRRKAKKGAFGTLNLSSIDWSREIPYGGDILKNYYVISTSPDFKARKQSVASAMILRMLQQNVLQVSRDAAGKVLIAFNSGADSGKLDNAEEKLRAMMYEASGENHILEEKEFSKWAKRNTSRLIEWTSEVGSSGLKGLRNGGYYNAGKYTETGRTENRKIVGLKRFLEETTLIRERTAPEVALWREYLVFASLIGIADKVARELKEIDPVMFEKAYSLAYDDMSQVIFLMNSYSNVLSRYAVPASSFSGGSSGGFSFSGGGGRSSFGGGGGFSGGGHSGVR